MQTVLNNTPLVTMYQTQLEASQRLTDAVFSGAEKIDQVVIEAIHRMFTQQLKFAQAMAAARDPQSAASTLQSSFMARGPDDAVNYQKEVMRIFAEVQNDIGRSLKDYMEHLGDQTASRVTMQREAGQARTNNAVFNPMTSMFSVWESAFKEVAGLAGRNMAAAQSSMENAASRNMEKVGAFTMAAADSISDAATAGSRSGESSSFSGSNGPDNDTSGDKRGGAGGRRK
jgi:phasin family protein